MIGQQRERDLAGRPALVEGLGGGGDERSRSTAGDGLAPRTLVSPASSSSSAKARTSSSSSKRPSSAWRRTRLASKQLVELGVPTGRSDDRLERGEREAAEEHAGAAQHLLRRAVSRS